MVVAEEDTWEHSGRHVPADIVLRSFRRLLVEDIFRKADEPLAEVAPSESLPRGFAVFSDL